MANLTNENLTPQEQQVLSTLIDGLYAEPHFSDVDAVDISKATGIPMKSIRGSIASLVKKDYIWIDGNDSGYQIIYLSISKWHLHPRWKDSEEYASWVSSQLETSTN